MHTLSTHVPFSGPSSDPILHGVATALSLMFPLGELTSGLVHDRPASGETGQDRVVHSPAPVSQLATARHHLSA